MSFKTPFRMEQQRILDSDGKEVRLWGVNYYAPFNHHYAGLKAKGVDFRKAIDRDIEDFQRMGVQLVRMHLFDRELTDAEGNLVETGSEDSHLAVLDYLVERLYQSGIYLMITAMAWWNSTQTQQELREGYAHITFGDLTAMGFANFCPKHMLMWHPKFLDIQENYLRQLFTHPNRYSGKTMPEYAHIALVEVINEPAYPKAETLEKLRREKARMEKNPIQRQELLLLEMYEGYRRESGKPDTPEEQDVFCASLVGRYIQRMFGVVDEYFGGRVLKTHIFYEFENPPFRKMLRESREIDLLSLAFYSDLACYSTPPERLIPDQLLWPQTPHGYARYVKGDIQALGKGLICYEWAMTCTLTGFDHVAAARVMASLGVQCAAYFTYTPRDLGDYNPGWVMQYMNLYHTPRRAVGFAAAGAVFRQTEKGALLPEDPIHWAGPGYRLDADTDFCCGAEGSALYWSGECASWSPQGSFNRILAQGSCPFARKDGNGAYLLERQSDTQWLLTVLPDQFYVNDPYRGRNYRGSAFLNRDIDVNEVPVVSRLKETGSALSLTLPGMADYRVERWTEGAWLPVPLDGKSFRADSGLYRVTKLEKDGGKAHGHKNQAD